MHKRTMLRLCSASAVIVLMAFIAFADYIPWKGREKISICLWNTNLLEKYAPYIQKQLPEAEIEFIVGNNDLDFYRFLSENGELPDIITSRRFSLNDAACLRESLLDLSETETAGSVYMTYLSSFQNSDGSVNWLPVCGVADSIIANKTLFDRYNIPLPSDYNSFVSACREFEKHGIRGFVSDFVYDYTCTEVLQGLSASELTSPEGKLWRLEYENPENDRNGLDKVIWPRVFERMERFIKDIKLNPGDIELGYDEINTMFSEEKAAMIRGIGADAVGYYEQGIADTVLLPYFCPDGAEWLLTYPSFHVALNKNLEQDKNKKETALKILDIMLSEEGQNVLSLNNDIVSYSKNAELQLSDKLNNIKPYIASNHLYIRLASERFFSVSKEVVQKMISGDYSAEQAYKAFDDELNRPADNTPEAAVLFNSEYPNDFELNGGNRAGSAVANTLREYYESDILISPSYNFTGPVIKTGYSKKQIGYMIMPNSCMAFLRDMTGAEVKALIRASVEGIEDSISPFNLSTLPVVSGAAITVKENADREFSLMKVKINGKEIDNNAIYRTVYLNSLFYCRHVAGKLYPEQGAEAFEMQDMGVREVWTKYISDGNNICEPTNYIFLR